jgi:hypothetical protein
VPVPALFAPAPPFPAVAAAAAAVVVVFAVPAPAPAPPLPFPPFRPPGLATLPELATAFEGEAAETEFAAGAGAGALDLHCPTPPL